MKHIKSASALGVALALTLAASGRARADLIINGGFESPAAPAGGYLDLSAGDPSLAGWTISSGTVDVVDAGFWPSYEGHQSLDLDGSGPGQIFQTFATTQGAVYRLDFAYANNYANPSASAVLSIFDALIGAEFFFDVITHGTSTASDMDYSSYSVFFTAVSGETGLLFSSSDNSAFGIVLDGVSVNPQAVPEPGSLALLGLGGVALVGYARRVRRHATA